MLKDFVIATLIELKDGTIRNFTLRKGAKLLKKNFSDKSATLRK